MANHTINEDMNLSKDGKDALFDLLDATQELLRKLQPVAVLAANVNNLQYQYDILSKLFEVKHGQQ